MSDGVQDSAIFLLTLGENEAAEVLKYMGPKEVQKISMAMVGLSNLSRDQITLVFHNFLQAASAKTSIGLDSNDYIRGMLTKALGDDKAAGMLDRILHSTDTSGIESLKWMDAGSVAEMIGNEHPQIIATILVHLEPDQAAAIMKMLTERTRNDVLLRISTLDGVQPVALRELNDVLGKLMSGGNKGKKNLQGGVGTAAEILNFMGGTLEAEMIESVRGFDPELAQKIEHGSRTAAPEPPHRVDESADAIHLLTRQVVVVAPELLVVLVALLRSHRQEGVDRHQRIVDLVREPRGERTEGSEPIGATHLLARPAQVVDQSRVLDGDRRLVAEALEQRAIVGREASSAASIVDGERADHALLAVERLHDQDLSAATSVTSARTGDS